VAACTWHRVEEGVLCKILDFSVLFCLFKKGKYPSVPVCSQFPKESRWEQVQRSCNRQLQSSLEKADVRKRDASPKWPQGEKCWGWGGVKQSCPHCVRPQETASATKPDLLRRDPALILVRECCCHHLSKLQDDKLHLFKMKRRFS